MKIIQREAFSRPEDQCLVNLQATMVYRDKSKQDLQKRFKVEYFGLIQLLFLLNDFTSTNIFPFSDSPEAVCLPGSKAAVPITQVMLVVFATVRGGIVINGRNEISPEASPSVNLTVPVTIPDDPGPEERDLGDPSLDKRTIKTR
ncbi:hypothetical protein TNIN_397201 [Trichonephila inaurata madagascariensis]|uniref:Uncharacterized protein n=1 Tax=Trichonephila inaurata madagascariensis TaxID=2747483 RepID=A0A8X6IS69_9ARAC|nr:hypothetical protein TNIN_461091 [Trichonephila inaurata madagascariensis]GFY55422.1 hypothetical protein TNIN_397201 [Trichonephila inaurata madagascariensis]